MKMFGYYALHSFKNQIKKLFKSWMLVFILACFVFGGLIGGIIGAVSSSLDDDEDVPAIEWDVDEAEAPEEESPSEADIPSRNALIELIAGGLILFMMVITSIGADKNGSRIFQPADVTLLFPSPLTPRSVLMFRVATQMGASVAASIYMIFQLPNLVINVGVSLPVALIMLFAWLLTVMTSSLLQVTLYLLASSSAWFKENMRRIIYGILIAVAAGFVIYSRLGGLGTFDAAAGYFNAPATRFIPLWGWIKGIVMYAAEGNAPMAALCVMLVIAGDALLIWISGRIKADYYEDAMAKSEQTAELMEAARSERTGLIKRKKDRSERLRRDGLNRGFGADVFFWKAMYNRFRFAHLGFLTKTMETYLAAGVIVGLVCRFAAGTHSVVPLVLIIGGMVFFRTLGNPLEEDTGIEWFSLIPETTSAKLFWSVLAGVTECLLDALPALIVGSLIVGTNPLKALVWLPLILSVDLYGTCTGSFIGLSTPKSSGRTVKQMIQILFIYFGLAPDAIILLIAIMSGHKGIGALIACLVNIALSAVFFLLTSSVIEPKGGKPARYRAGSDSLLTDPDRLTDARRTYSRMGLGCVIILGITTVLQLAAVAVAGDKLTDGSSEWLMWVMTFVPLYVIALPIGYAFIRRTPANPPEQHKLSAGRWFRALFIGMFLMYAGNIIGTMITMALGNLTDTAVENPLSNLVLNTSIWMRVLIVVIIGPLVEEFIFRKLLIDRMRDYGEKLAIFTSALMFGLFHGNLSQFFYAFALGLVFGYIYTRTGRLRYSAALHMTVNFMGSVVAPLIVTKLDLGSLTDMTSAEEMMKLVMSPEMIIFAVYVLTLLVCSVIGFVLLIAYRRDIVFAPAQRELPEGNGFRTAYVNAGMILFVIGCAAMIVVSLI